jgi:hypothetical protein
MNYRLIGLWMPRVWQERACGRDLVYIQELCNNSNRIQSTPFASEEQQAGSLVKIQRDVTSIMQHLRVPQADATFFSKPDVIESMMRSRSAVIA